MSARNLAVLVAASAVALGVAACGSTTGSTTGGTGAAPAATVTATAPAVGPAPAAAEFVPVAAPASAPGAASPPAAATKRGNCPVTVDDLQVAVKNRAGDSAAEIDFHRIVCYRGYAVATTPENKISDEEYFVFKYTADSWSVISSATGDICPGVPADVKNHFRAAHYGACR
jgi:hypothetical protein